MLKDTELWWVGPVLLVSLVTLLVLVPALLLNRKEK